MKTWTGQLSFLEKVFCEINHFSNCINSINNYSYNNEFGSHKQMKEEDRIKSLGLMRINHCGELCAQALYRGQISSGKTNSIKNDLQEALMEEKKHLQWCKTRILELGGSPSRSEPIFYLISFAIGYIAGLCGDSTSYSFILECENQVMEHIKKHLLEMPIQDIKSRKILETMYADEKKHANNAKSKGGHVFSNQIKRIMHFQSRVMIFFTSKCK